MTVRLVLVVLLALTAGCSTFGTAGDTPTVTPAPVPEQNETTPANPLPPGVTGNGVSDPARLALAHVQATSGQSYTWRDRSASIRKLDNGTLQTELRQVAYVENETTYTYWTNRRPDETDGPFSFYRNYTEYADEDGRSARYVDSGEVIYREYPTRPARSRVGSEAGDAIRRYLHVENATVAVTLVDGERYYTINGTGNALPSGWEISNYTVNATVSPDGFVRQLAVSYVRTQGDEREAISYEYRYSRVGNTTVEPPDWVAFPDGEFTANGTTTPDN